MSLRGMATNDKRLACKYGFSEFAGYLDCFNCEYLNDCEVLEQKKNIQAVNEIQQNFKNFNAETSQEKQERLNKKIVEDYLTDLKNCETVGDKVGAFFRMLKNSWNEAKKINS